MPSIDAACAADRSNLPSTKVTSHTHRAGFGNCHRVRRPSEERNHQDPEPRRAEIGWFVVEEVTWARTHPSVRAADCWV